MGISSQICYVWDAQKKAVEETISAFFIVPIFGVLIIAKRRAGDSEAGDSAPARTPRPRGPPAVLRCKLSIYY
jgi:hypothetical protein